MLETSSLSKYLTMMKLNNALAYRREIDGLRGVAVLSVVFFHAGFVGFSGGFVGVDVFFVISGYLITSILLRELNTETFSLLTFYERRARRILPALFLVLFFCSVAGWFLLLPDDLSRMATSMLAVLAFVSNIYYWRTEDYFSPTTELLPLIHTWTLAVEEQFYIFFPFLLVILMRYSRKLTVVVLGAIFVVSLLLAEWGWRNAISPNFYLLPTRAWELLAGSLLAFISVERVRSLFSSRIAGAGAAAGLGLISYAVLAFDDQTPNPSIFIAVPVIGSVLVILFASPRNNTGRLLSSRALVGIGLISYSMYLWHQPILAFARTVSPNELSVLQTSYLIAGIILISMLSWRFIEQPYRSRSFRRRQVFKHSAIGATALALVALSFLMQQGWQERVSPSILAKVDTRRAESWWPNCKFVSISNATSAQSCIFGDPAGELKVALWGDSHANMYYEALDEAFKRDRIQGMVVRARGCEVITGVSERSAYGLATDSLCRNSHRELLEYLDSRADFVMISIRWTYKLYPAAGEIDDLSFDNSQGGVEKNKYVEYCVYTQAGVCDQAPEAKARQVAQFLHAMSRRRFRALVLYPAPEVGWHVARYNWARYLMDGTAPDDIYTDHSRYIHRNRFVLRLFESASNASNVEFFRTDSLLCPQGRCYAQRNGVALYHDDDHLNFEGASRVVDAILPRIKGGGETLAPTKHSKTIELDR